MNLAVDFVVVECASKNQGGCAVVFAMTRSMYDETKRTGSTWYCPNGHPWVWDGPTTEQKLRDAQAREVHLADQLRAAEADAEAARVATARVALAPRPCPGRPLDGSESCRLVQAPHCGGLT